MRCTNYGFRADYQVWDPIDNLRRYGQSTNIAIEDDIIGAYNNVNNDLLLKLLNRRIEDKNFLKFIKTMLKSGIMDQKQYQHSLTDSTRKNSQSSLLFNIYMFELDKFIFENIIFPIDQENNKLTKGKGKTNPQSSLLTKKVYKLSKL